MKLTTNLVAAFVFAFCFAAIPNLGGCDRNGETTTTKTTESKPAHTEDKVTVKHPDGSKEETKTETTKNPDGTVDQTHTEKKTP